MESRRVVASDCVRALSNFLPGNPEKEETIRRDDSFGALNNPETSNEKQRTT